MILFGMGELGRKLLPKLRPRAACDNDAKLWGHSIDGVEILSPIEAAALYPDEEYVVTIYNGSAARKQLADYGIKNIRHFFDVIGRDTVDREKVNELLPLLADDDSRNEVLDQASGRVLTEHAPIDELYFPGFFEPRADEVFVDCGAFNGDSIRAFKSWAKSWREIYAFEPVNHVDTSATVIPCAVGECGEFVRFTEDGPGSCPSIDGRMVQVVCLDEVFRSIVPTFIKMDIEGAEPQAIRGAARILREHKPKLAICLYHKRSHLWEIPLLVHSINPDYELRIRRYAEDCWETVLYAQ